MIHYTIGHHNYMNLCNGNMDNLIINGKGINATNNDGSWIIDANSGAIIIEDIIPHIGDSISKGETIQTVFNQLFNNILPRIPIVEYSTMFKTDENGIDNVYPDVTGLNANSIYIRLEFANSDSPLYISCWLLQSDIERLKDIIDTKASKSEYDVLKEEVETKVSNIQMDYLIEQINLKADKTSLDRLQSAIDKKANNDKVSSLESIIYNKADKTSLNTLEDTVANLSKSLTDYASNDDLQEVVNNINTLNDSINNKANNDDIDNLDNKINEKANKSDIDDINKRFDKLENINIDDLIAKLNTISLNVNKLSKDIESNKTDIRRKADLSYVEKIDTELKRATTKLDTIVETKADKSDLSSKANKTDLEALAGTTTIINNNIIQLRKNIDSKASIDNLDKKINEVKHSISDLSVVEKNDIRSVNSKISNIEKNIKTIETNIDSVEESIKDWIQVLTPEQYKRIPTSRIDPAKLYMCIKFGKPYALYIGSVLIAERNVETATGFAYTFPLTF